jgi:hypothetical protein
VSTFSGEHQTTPIPGSKLYDDCVANGIIKDEENYLLNLDSGYNLAAGSINLTNFTDKELAQKQRKLQIRITHNYLKKRPLQYISFLSGIIFRKVKRMIKKIGLFAIADRARQMINL